MERINLALIKQRRDELNISMQEMAGKIGKKNASTWFKYEKGEYVFDAHHIPILSKELNLTKDELYFFEKDVAKTEIKQSV